MPRRRCPPGQVQTFAIGFREPSFDESANARAVAAHFGSEHHEEILSIERARELIPEVLGRLDEPFGDASIVPTFQLCEFARRRITVALGATAATSSSRATTRSRRWAWRAGITRCSRHG